MDFFSRQDDVRARSHAFFIAFGLAVALAVVILYFAITGCFLALTFNARMPAISGSVGDLPGFIYGYPPRVLSLRPFLIVGATITLIIMTVSIIKTRAIKEGGAAYVIESIGGELIETPRDFQETQLLNVVEEMAVAASLPRPQVYILPDDSRSINAITAGLDQDDTVIAVTKGAVNHLNREELQGVVAHEFAHIFNGDYSLNLIMAGWLYGLMFFYIQGLRLIRNMWPSVQAIFDGGRRHRLPPFMCIPGLIMGLLLTIGGWIGQVMAELVQSAFSRQREFLADAFAVQFTRNTAGLAGAMKKIAWVPRHGTLRNGQALLMRAFFIATPSKADGLFQTHPPLEDRIRALEPAWDGALQAIDHPDFQPPRDLDRKYAASGFSDTQEAFKGVRRMRALAGALDGPSGALVLGLLAAGGGGASLGDPRAGALGNKGPANSQAAPAGPVIPENLRAAANDPERVSAVLAAVFLMNDPTHKAAQLELIKRYLGAETASSAADFKAGLADEQRLPLLAQALPSLKRLEAEARSRLAQVAKALAAVDGKLDLFEIAACQMLKKPLGLTFSAAASAAVTSGGSLGAYLEKVQADVVTVLSILAHLGSADEEAARCAFSEAMQQFHQWPPMEIRPKASGGVRELVQALDRLAGAPDKIKKNMSLAAVTIVLHGQSPVLVQAAPEGGPVGTDQPGTDSIASPLKLNAREYELLAALSAALDLPQPLSSRT